MRTRMLLVIGFLAAILIASAGASGGQRYADPREDAATAPDITDVSVTSDDAGLITIRAAVANRNVLDPEDEIGVGFDADRQLSTGRNGLDYMVGVYKGVTPYAMAWSDRDEEWLDLELPTYAYAWDAATGTATFTVDRRDLGWTSGFEFFVGAWDSSADEPADYAPSDDDRWTYSLHLPFALRITPLTTFDVSGRPAAGKTFSLAARVVREDTGATLHAGKIGCTATVGGKRLTLSTKPRFFTITVTDGSGDFTQAVCDWKVPAAAKGKALHAAVTVSLSGKSVTRTFTGKVR